jgi:hypothetical protein
MPWWPTGPQNGGDSSPITRRVYNLGLDEFIAWFTKATVTTGRVALKARKLGRVSTHQNHGGPETGGRQRSADAGSSCGERPDQGRAVQQGPRGQLALAPPGADAGERAGRAYEKGLRVRATRKNGARKPMKQTDKMVRRGGLEPPRDCSR